MNKRTIDADELHKLTALLITSRDNEHIAWSNVLDAAFPLVEEPVTGRGLGLTPLPKSEAPAHWDYRFIRYAAGHDAVLVEYDGQGAFRWKVFSDSNLSSPGRWYKTPQEALEAAGLPLSVLGQAAASPTHNLVPLPESEWPEAHRGWVEGCELFALGDHHVLLHGAVTGNWWVYPRHTTSLHLGDGPTPAAALEAAGLPVELLEGLKRPESSSELGDSHDEAVTSEAKNDRTCLKPAHENPRVVAAAVEMVKEVEQHKAKAGRLDEQSFAYTVDAATENHADSPKWDGQTVSFDVRHRRSVKLAEAARDREEWLAQFPAWVLEWCAELEFTTPVRMIGDTLIYHRAVDGGMKWATKRGGLVPDMHATIIDAAKVANAHLYADGNVPLWGDETDCGTVEEILHGGRVVVAGGSGFQPHQLRLLRRHPAIADLPGIRNDSSADRSDSNDSAGEVTGYPQVELREGQRVTCEARYPNSVGFLVDHDPGSGRLEDRNTVCFGGTTWDTFRDDDLTPLPPPLIDNGDGTWTMEGYGMAVIMEIDGSFVWRLDADGGCLWSDESWDEATEAAEDLWRRMEGVG